MVSHLYRFRSAKHVLDDFNELEAQEIYFCPPGDLNDPVEGFKDLFWSGDEIIWRNLLKHYVLSLIELAPLCFGGEADCGRSTLRNIVFRVPDELPDAPVRAIYGRVSQLFLREPAAVTFVAVMASKRRPIRRRELAHYLRALHPFALDLVLKELADFGLVQLTAAEAESARRLSPLRHSATNMIESMPLLPGANEKADAFFSANEATISQLDLISEYQIDDRDAKRPLSFFCRYFPAAYVAALERLVHPDWYVACFSANPANASMWGAYGDGHRGVCLKFKTSPNAANVPTLSLRRVMGLGGSKDGVAYSWDFMPMEFHKVVYAPAYPAIDFFNSLGNLSQEKLNRFWYRGDNNDYSSCLQEAFRDQAARDAYWKAFEASALFKTPEWAHEEEYRLVLHSGFDLREKSMRKLEYKFSELVGIVFGARTDMEDKLKIMRIIDQKCTKERRCDFEFLEMRYAPESSTFHLSPLSFLKIRHASTSAE